MRADDLRYALKRWPRRRYISKRVQLRPVRFIQQVADTRLQLSLITSGAITPESPADSETITVSRKDITPSQSAYRIQIKALVHEDEKKIRRLYLQLIDRSKEDGLREITFDRYGIDSLRAFIDYCLQDHVFDADGDRVKVPDIGHEVDDTDALRRDMNRIGNRAMVVDHLSSLLGEKFASLTVDQQKSLAALLSQPKIVRLVEEGDAARIISAFVDSDVRFADLAELIRRRKGTAEFKELMETSDAKEEVWQKFFDRNRWIFGMGLDHRVWVAGTKFRASLSGGLQTSRRETDALLKAFGAHSSIMLVEIKRPSAELVRATDYREELYLASEDVEGGVAQLLQEAQRLSSMHVDEEGLERDRALPNKTYRPHQPTLVLVVGRISSLEGMKGDVVFKRASFERYRASQSQVKIITFDELYNRCVAMTEAIEDCLSRSTEG